VKKWFQSVLSKCNVYRYNKGKENETDGDAKDGGGKKKKKPPAPARRSRRQVEADEAAEHKKQQKEEFDRLVAEAAVVAAGEVLINRSTCQVKPFYL
jgi:hypothetical protein